jgi:hypothetical protein
MMTERRVKMARERERREAVVSGPLSCALEIVGGMYWQTGEE